MTQPATDPTGVVQPAPMPGAGAPGFVVFQLADFDGTPHRYEVQPHPPTEGTEIVFSFVALGAEPFASVIASVFAAEDALAEVGTLGDALDLDLVEMAGRIDWGKVGGDVKRSILSMPLSTLVRDVLRFTWRDGRPLANDIHYNAAFSRNYGELLQAVWEVAGANRFFPRLNTSEKGGGKPTKTPG